MLLMSLTIQRHHYTRSNVTETKQIQLRARFGCEVCPMDTRQYYIQRRAKHIRLAVHGTNLNCYIHSRGIKQYLRFKLMRL